MGCTGQAPLYHQDAKGKLAGTISHAHDKGYQAAGSHAAEFGGPQSPLQNGKPNGRPRSRGDYSKSGLGAPESSGSSNRSEGREFFRRCCPAFCEPNHNASSASIYYTAGKCQPMLGSWRSSLLHHSQKCQILGLVIQIACRARARLSNEVFSIFLQAIKDMNAGLRGRSETLQTAANVFVGPDSDLYHDFRALLDSHLPSR